MIEKSQKLFFSEPNGRQRSWRKWKWFIRPGQNPCLVYHKPRTRHRLHRLGWAPRLNGLLTATGQQHQNSRPTGESPSDVTLPTGCRLFSELNFSFSPCRKVHKRYFYIYCRESFKVNIQHCIERDRKHSWWNARVASIFSTCEKFIKPAS